MDATASLFANAQANASREDIALGLIGLVLQSIGSATILSSLNSDIRDFVLIGNLSLLPQCELLFPVMEKIYDVRFIVPKNSEYVRQSVQLYKQITLRQFKIAIYKRYEHFCRLIYIVPIIVIVTYLIV